MQAPLPEAGAPWEVAYSHLTPYIPSPHHILKSKAPRLAGSPAFNPSLIISTRASGYHRAFALPWDTPTSSNGWPLLFVFFEFFVSFELLSPQDTFQRDLP